MVNSQSFVTVRRVMDDQYLAALQNEYQSLKDADERRDKLVQVRGRPLSQHQNNLQKLGLQAPLLDPGENTLLENSKHFDANSPI